MMGVGRVTVTVLGGLEGGKVLPGLDGAFDVPRRRPDTFSAPARRLPGEHARPHMPHPGRPMALLDGARTSAAEPQLDKHRSRLRETAKRGFTPTFFKVSFTAPRGAPCSPAGLLCAP